MDITLLSPSPKVFNHYFLLENARMFIHDFERLSNLQISIILSLKKCFEFIKQIRDKYYDTLEKSQDFQRRIEKRYEEHKRTLANHKYQMDTFISFDQKEQENYQSLETVRKEQCVMADCEYAMTRYRDMIQKNQQRISERRRGLICYYPFESKLSMIDEPDHLTKSEMLKFIYEEAPMSFSRTLTESEMKNIQELIHKVYSKYDFKFKRNQDCVERIFTMINFLSGFC